MRKVIVIALLLLSAGLAAQDSGVIVAEAVDTTLVVLPSGDSLAVVVPVPGPMPTATDVPADQLVDWFVNEFVSWWLVVIFMVVGFLAPYVPVLRNLDDKEMMMLAFVLAGIALVVLRDQLLGSGSTFGDAVRIFVNASLSTRIYAWGYKVALRLYALVSARLKGGKA
ncbi:MAG: hypothetical protein D6790_21930 [Caldilineae bacterium]|nr:MAG: hypothetical protein D6790_21930 [Caldilineae bacterium]